MGLFISEPKFGKGDDCLFRFWHLNVEYTAFVDCLLQYHTTCMCSCTLDIEEPQINFVKYKYTAKPTFRKKKKKKKKRNVSVTCVTLVKYKFQSCIQLSVSEYNEYKLFSKSSRKLHVFLPCFSPLRRRFRTIQFLNGFPGFFIIYG